MLFAEYKRAPAIILALPSCKHLEYLEGFWVRFLHDDSGMAEACRGTSRTQPWQDLFTNTQNKPRGSTFFFFWMLWIISSLKNCSCPQRLSYTVCFDAPTHNCNDLVIWCLLEEDRFPFESGFFLIHPAMQEMCTACTVTLWWQHGNGGNK